MTALHTALAETPTPIGRVYTTGQVAKICRVAPKTASKWIDAGKLRGYRIPLSQDRRVPEPELIRFLREHKMPVPPELGGGRRLAVDCLLPNGHPDRITAFELGELTAGGAVQRALFGCDDGLSMAVRLARLVRVSSPTSKLALLLSDDRPAVPDGLFDVVFTVPAKAGAWLEGKS